MNIALIFAGGVGLRMNTKSTPKQFLKLHGKDIIIHTIEHFEFHSEIDAILIVCIKDWIDYLKEQISRLGFKKVKWITEGDVTGQDSIYRGLCLLEKECPDDTIVLIHDGVRPLITQQTISDNIACVKQYGSSITVAPSVETVIIIDENSTISQISDRSRCMLAKAPQCFILKDILAAHKEAINSNKHNFIDSASIMSYYGHTLHTVMGSTENIKITTPSDYYIFRAIKEAKENSQIFGI